jgi:hypothetical protein
LQLPVVCVCCLGQTFEVVFDTCLQPVAPTFGSPWGHNCTTCGVKRSTSRPS